MKPLRLIGILLQPSWLSLLLTFGLSLFILFLVTLPVTQASGILYDLLFGSEYGNAPEFVAFARDTLLAFSSAVFGNETLNKVLFFICWLLLGTVVYFISASITNGIAAANEVRSELHYMNLHKLELEKEVGKRVALRLATGLNWLFYWLFFIRFLLPYITALAQIGVSSLDSWQGWAYGLASIVLLVLSLHGHIVLLRFLLLRPRVFGSW